MAINTIIAAFIEDEFTEEEIITAHSPKHRKKKIHKVEPEPNYWGFMKVLLIFFGTCFIIIFVASRFTE